MSWLIDAEDPGIYHYARRDVFLRGVSCTVSEESILSITRYTTPFRTETLPAAAV